MPAPNRNRTSRKKRPIVDEPVDMAVIETAVETERTVVPIYASREPTQGIERVGDILRRRRQQRGDDLQQIADYLCIRKAFLIALEESDYNELPPDAYVIGFLRTYAAYLGFDGADAINRYRSEMAGRRRKPALVLPTPISEGRTPSPPIMIGAAAVAILIYALWYGLSTGDRTAVNMPPPLPTTAAPAIDNPSNTSNSIALPTAPPPVIPLTVNGAAAAPPTEQHAAPAASHFSVRAEKETWVLITDGKNPPVLDHVMKPGEVFVVPDQEGLKLTTGNSSGIVLMQDGKDLPKLSRDSSILHDIPLDPKLRKAPAGKSKE